MTVLWTLIGPHGVQRTGKIGAIADFADLPADALETLGIYGRSQALSFGGLIVDGPVGPRDILPAFFYL